MIISTSVKVQQIGVTADAIKIRQVDAGRVANWNGIFSSNAKYSIASG